MDPANNESISFESGIPLTSIPESVSLTQLSAHSCGSSRELLESMVTTQRSEQKQSSEQQSCKLAIYKSDCEEVKNEQEDNDDDSQHIISKLILINRLLSVLVIFGVFLLVIMFGISYSAVIGCGGAGEQSFSGRIKDLPKILFGRYIFSEANYRNSSNEKVNRSAFIHFRLCDKKYSINFSDTLINSITFHDNPSANILSNIRSLRNISMLRVFEKEISERNFHFIKWPLQLENYKSNFAVGNELASVQFTSSLHCDTCEQRNVFNVKITYIFGCRSCNGCSLVIDQLTEVRAVDDVQVVFCKDDGYSYVEGPWFLANMNTSHHIPKTTHNTTLTHNRTNYDGLKYAGSLIDEHGFRLVSIFTNQNVAKLIKMNNRDETNNLSDAVKLDVFGHSLKECNGLLNDEKDINGSMKTHFESGHTFVLHNQYIISE